MFTLNKDEIPMPHIGEQFVQGSKIKLTKEFVDLYLQGVTQVDFKVIALAVGSIPSEVAQWTYEVKHGI